MSIETRFFGFSVYRYAGRPEVLQIMLRLGRKRALKVEWR